METKLESFQRNRLEGKFCRKCVWHFCLQPGLVGCEYHLCNDHGRGHPGGEGCPKFLKGNPKVRQGMIDPSEQNIRIKLGLDPPKRKVLPAADAAASRVGAKSVNSTSAAKGESSVHSLAPPFPTEPALLGFGGDPIGGGKGDAAAPRPHREGGKWPPRCYIPEKPNMSRKGADLDMDFFLELLRDRGGLYGMSKETGVGTGSIAHWKKYGRISVPMAERIRAIYGVDVTRK